MAARPDKEELERRTGVLQIRITEAERRLIDRAAKSASLKTSSWARSVLMIAARQQTQLH